MSRTRAYSRVRRSVLAGASVLGLVALSTTPSAMAAPSHAQISGSGSSWSANAVSQWVSDVSSSGLRVDFTNSGSAQGRKDFTNLVTDFAVSDIGYQGTDKITGEQDTNCNGGTCRDFAYEPIVAGGTAFPYQVKVAGKLVRNLRLSGETLTKIFTYKITNWNDPQITADNNGRKLPSLRIIPVVHSEGSGSTAQFTTYMDTQYESIWRAFIDPNHKLSALAPGQAFTEFYPSPHGGQGIAQSGSDGVMNFVSSNGANGAIGFDEYSYPLAKNFPVAKLLNKAGFYTLPDQYNVAVALTHANINMNKNDKNYLLQKLNNVYVAPEVQAYPMSSYSYFLIPTSPKDPRMTTAKRQTLADYLYYSVCQGQKEIGPIGYSPLPINLVQASFDQTNKLKVADPGVDLTKRDVSTCQNPTFVAGQPKLNHLAQIAPVPPACDKQGAGPCGSANTGTGGSAGGSTGSGTGGSTGSGTGSSTGTGTGTGGSTGTGTGGTKTTGNGAAIGDGGTLPTQVDENGNVVTNGSNDGSSGGDAQPNAVELAGYQPPASTKVLAPLAVIELLALLILPPAVYIVSTRRRKKSS